ncbi:Uncharacterised protein [Mycobacteroides abscessus]|nr:Uncharacterised protein [Mycobacteroides abscessus]
MGTSTASGTAAAKGSKKAFSARKSAASSGTSVRVGNWPVPSRSARSFSSFVANFRKSHAVCWFSHDEYRPTFFESANVDVSSAAVPAAVGSGTTP